MEYSRFLILKNAEEKSEEIERCLDKIEKDVDKNIEALKKLDEEFKISSNNYKEKKEIYNKAVRDNKSAENAYIKILNKTRENFENIELDDISFAKEFLSSENKDKKKELNAILIDNGINEKNPFDNDVISNAVNTSFSIYVKEIDLFLNGYEKTKKLLAEIELDDVKSDKHNKFINDTNVKLHFLDVEKEYIVGFLDNERIAAIYDKKTHRKLMLEACRNFNSDLEHLNNMYDIILKEAASRGSKRLYKDNYRRNYLSEIEKVAEGAKVDANKLKANSVAVMNLNYWRIEGISRVQEVFEKDMLNVYGRDISEIFPEEIALEKKSRIRLKSSKEALKAALIKLEENETEKNLDEILDDSNVHNEKEEYSVSEDIDEINTDEKIENISKIDEFEKIETSDKINQIDNIEKNSEAEKIEEIEEIYEEENAEATEATEVNSNSDEDTESNKLFEKISMLDDMDSDLSNDKKDEIEEEDEEESIIDFYFKSSDKAEKKRKARDARMLEKETKSSIFKKLMGVNGNRGKREA